VFQRGIQGYLAEFQGGNATGEDLWTHLGAASAEPVTDLMRSWILQPGFPRLSASLSRRKGRNRLCLRQERFLADPAARRRTAPATWIVPLVIAYDAGDGPRTHRVLLDRAEQTFELPGRGPVRWVYPDADATGCYRNDLDPPLLGALLRHGIGHLPPPARASVLQDLWALVHAGLAGLPRLLDALVALRGDHEPLVARAVIARLGYLEAHLVDRPHRAALRDLTGWLLGPCLRELGWDPRPGEPPDRAPLRAAVVEALGTLARDPDVLAEAARRADAERLAPAAVDPNLAATVVRLAAQQGDLARFRAFVDEFTARKARRAAPEVQARYLSALAAFEAPAVVRALHDLCLGDVIPQEQLRAVLGALLGRPAAQEATWTFLKARWDDLAPRVGAMGLARLVEATGALPAARRQDVAAFFAAHPVEGARRAVQKVDEALRLRAGLIRRERRNLSLWLERHPWE
jgi:puromycin-sensitive aminopeptidase